MLTKDLNVAAKIIRLFIALVALLPLTLARGLGAVIGQWAWLVRSRGSRTALTNLRLCFPELTDRQIKALAGQSMRHWGMTLCEIPGVWRRGRDALDWIVDIEGMDAVDAALAKGKGVIIVSPHHGNWEMVGYWAGTLGPITTLYQPPRRFNLDDMLRRVRGKTGATLVPTTARGVSSLIKALKRGELTGILPDMEPEKNSGVFAPFFGIPTLTMTLIHSLQQRTGATALVGFAQRVPGGFKMVFTEPGPDILASEPETAVAELNKAIEYLVRRAPEQYQWEYKRFKRRPEGMARLY